jgi:hypothetical protein
MRCDSTRKPLRRGGRSRGGVDSLHRYLNLISLSWNGKRASVVSGGMCLLWTSMDG